MKRALLLLAACGGGSHGHAGDAQPPDAPPPCNGGMLFALDRGLANTGDTLELEGAFGADATVVFGGNVQEVANVLGTGRATVVVPDAARSGPLQLCGSGPATLAFDHPSYPITVGTFTTTFDQAQRGERAPQLFAANYSYASVVVGNAVYVIGGVSVSGTGPGAQIERATIRSDGSLGVFMVVPNENLSFPRSGHTATVIGNHVYVIGGGANGSAFDSIDRATIQPDGTLGPFQIDPTVTLHAARANHTAAIIGGYLYVIGGSPGGTSGSPLDSLERAPIQNDGTLGPFEVVPQKLSLGRASHGSAVIGNYLYVFGGGDGNQAIDSIDRATIGPDGSLEAFGLVSSHLATSRVAFASAVIGRSLYLFGGYAGSGFNTSASTSIERAPILPDGTLDTFAMTTSTLTTPRVAFQVVTTANAVYAISGQGVQSGVAPASCEFASLDRTGDVGAFAAAGNLASPRASGGAFASATTLYAFGGTSGGTPIGSIEQATLDPDGALGSLAPVSGNSLAVPRAGFATAIAWGFLYVIGGHDANGATAALERTPIGDDGKLGAFAAYPVASLTAPREQHSAIVIADSLYVIGGKDATGAALATLERVTINPGGSLQPWQQVANTMLVTPRSGHASALLGKYLYVIGGTDGAGNVLDSIEAVQVYSDNSLGIFTKVGTLTTPRTGARAFVIGDQLYVVGGSSGSGALATIERATIHADGSLGAFAATTTLAAARAEASVAAAGNFIYVVGGSDGTNALGSVEQAKLQ